MTRVLFLGDLAGTGFGTVTRDLGRELLARGLDVRFMSLNEGTATISRSRSAAARRCSARLTAG